LFAWLGGIVAAGDADDAAGEQNAKVLNFMPDCHTASLRVPALSKTSRPLSSCEAALQAVRPPARQPMLPPVRRTAQIIK
jgi:hypothetical protein